jgi:hypothetical protein
LLAGGACEADHGQREENDQREPPKEDEHVLKLLDRHWVAE